eukprot:scaffold5258_cov26-Cyclotella_meneghiniana.AAC.1
MSSPTDDPGKYSNTPILPKNNNNTPILDYHSDSDEDHVSFAGSDEFNDDVAAARSFIIAKKDGTFSWHHDNFSAHYRILFTVMGANSNVNEKKTMEFKDMNTGVVVSLVIPNGCLVFLPAKVAGEEQLNGRLIYHRVYGIQDSLLFGYHYRCYDINDENPSRIVGLDDVGDDGLGTPDDEYESNKLLMREGTSDTNTQKLLKELTEA